ncbi:hypothetical protein FACS1894181_02870 [Bacteroidia bacterium]|nr:hypothetical protein FACS1894181_02870 [Bacteroidia bacterium]
MAERSLAVGVSYLGMAGPGDGIPATTGFVRFETIEENSVAFNFGEPKTIDFRAEGMDEPWASFDKSGDPDSIEFNIPSPKAEEMLAICGGSISGGKWSAPVSMQNIRKTVKIVTVPYDGKYTEYVFANCKISGKLNQAPGSEQTDLLQVKCTRLAAISEEGIQHPSWTREVKDVV